MEQVKLFKILIVFVLFYPNFSFCNKEDNILHSLRKIEKNNKKVSLVGSIQLPEEMICCPYVYLCYKGQHIKFKNSRNDDLLSFIIKDFNVKKMGILFARADNVNFCSDENTIAALKFASHDNYKYFKLSKTEICSPDNEQFNSWNINESRLKSFDDQIKVPLNTLIILIDPRAIAFHLEPTNWKVGNNHIVELPKVIITKVRSKERLIKSCLALPNFRPFNCQSEERSKLCNGNVRLCMPV